MKIWVDCCNLGSFLDGTDLYTKLGIGWYRHSKNHKWFGVTIELYLVRWLINIYYVDNYKEYDLRINQRRKRNK